MLEFYLDTVAIYFIVYIATGILLRDEFIKARNKLRKELNKEDEVAGYITTTITYLLISFVPIIRLISLIGKMWLTLDPDGYINRVKENEK